MPRKKRIEVDRFSQGVAEALIKKKKYTDHAVARLIRAVQESPSVKLLLYEMGLEPGINKQWVFGQRKKMGVKAVSSYPKSTGSRKIDAVTIRMVRNLVRLTDFRPPKIARIMKSIGKPISVTSIIKVMQQDGPRQHSRRKSEYAERNRRINELTKSFKRKSEEERLRNWISLNGALQSLKKAYASERNSDVKKRLNEKMSNVFEYLEALEPVIPEAMRKAHTAEFLEGFVKRLKK